MNKRLRKAIEAVIRDAEGCSTDKHGYLAHMDSTLMAVLIIEYDQECRKQGWPRLRLTTPSTDSGAGCTA